MRKAGDYSLLDDGVAERFASEWQAAWNAHDVDRVLKHFHEGVEFRSPVARRVLAETDGVLRGKDALREYWSRALVLIPDLRFEVTALFVGIDSLVIQYQNQKDVKVAEVLIFEGPLVVLGMGTYPLSVINPAGVGSGS